MWLLDLEPNDCICFYYRLSIVQSEYTELKVSLSPMFISPIFSNFRTNFRYLIN